MVEFIRRECLEVGLKECINGKRATGSVGGQEKERSGSTRGRYTYMLETSIPIARPRLQDHQRDNLGTETLTVVRINF